VLAKPFPNSIPCCRCRQTATTRPAKPANHLQLLRLSTLELSPQVVVLNRTAIAPRSSSRSGGLRGTAGCRWCRHSEVGPGPRVLQLHVLQWAQWGGGRARGRERW
jgi:hypothetical protein